MSGSTVGGVLGAVVGSFIPGIGTQLGWMVGGLIGGVVAPEKIHGPKLTDARSQTAQDGVPRTYGYGTFPCTGNLIWVDPTIKEVKNKDRGKGGPEQITYTYTRSYAIAVCRGPIEGYLIIKRNGKIVYDARTDAELSALGFTSDQIAETRAAQSKFEQIATFYYGDETQTADATIVAVKGVGNVPAYRGTAYIVCTDDDVTELQGAVPQFEFVVRECGTTTQTGGGGGTAGWITYASPQIQPSPDGADWLSLPAISTAPVTANSSMAAVGGMLVLINAAADGRTYYAPLNDLTNFTEGPSMGGVSGGAKVPLAVGGRLYIPQGLALAYSDDVTSGYTTLPGLYHPAAGYTPGDYFIAGDEALLVRGGQSAMHVLVGGTWTPGAVTHAANVLVCGAGGGGRIAVGGHKGLEGTAVIYFTNDGHTLSESTVPSLVGNVYHILHVGGDEWLAFCSADTMGDLLWRSTDNCASFSAVSLGEPVKFHGPGYRVADVDATGRVTCLATTGAGSTLKYFTSTDRVTWTECPHDDGFPSNIMALPSQAPTGIELPDAPGWYFDPQGGFNGGSSVSIEGCDLTLDEIVAAECAQRDVTDIDVSELTDEVIGFRVSSETSPQTNIQSLQSGFMFDGSEYDGVLHFPKRGGAATFALTVDDLAARDGDPIEWERAQEAELLRKVTVGYIDPATTYTTTTQDWERRTGTIQALGEGAMELPVVQDKDWAKQAAEKSLKVGWAETDTCRFSLTRAHSHLVPAQVGTITDADGVAYRIRITRIEDDGGVRLVEAKRERSNTYNSNAQGAAGPNPGFPGSSLRGPTDAVVMNMPVLRDEDDKPGVYWAARGYLSGWQGAVLQVRRGSDWVTLGQVNAPATMGELLFDLPAHAGDLDETNTITVKMGDDLASVTFHELLSEKNALAIQYPNGTVEVVQFQTATEIAPGEYECTTLIRGRLDTVRGPHVAGAKVVFLDELVKFIPLEMADLGQTLTFRAVSIGTDPDAAPTQQITLTTIESVREWQPDWVRWERDAGNALVVQWLGRARLGTDADPAHSQHFGGYLVTIKSGSTTKSWTTRDEWFALSAAEQSGIFGSSTFTPSLVQAEAISASGDAAGGSYTFPSGLSGWIAAQSGWSVSGGIVKYDPTVSGQATGFIRLNVPVPFVSGQVFRAKVHAYSDVMNVVGAAGSAYYRAGGYTDMSEAGTVHTYMSTLTSYPKPNADQIAPALYAMTDGVAPVYFENLSFSVT